MSQIVTFNGASYTLPTSGNLAWGANLTSYLVAISNGALQKSGGTFTLTADVNFGVTFGLLSQYYKSRSSNIATAGIVRLAVGDSVGWRNNANSANLLLSINGSDQLTFAGTAVALSTVFAQDTNGLVPGPTAAEIAANKVLRADQTWTEVGVGTVTSVAVTTPNSLSVGGSPVTTDGTIAISNRALSAKTDDYTLTATDCVVTFDVTAANRTATLPTAVGASGTQYTIKKIDSSVNTVTLNTTSSQTIDGSASGALKLCTQNESITVCSDGANWVILNHKCNTNWTAWTPTGTWNTNTTYSAFKRRVGDTEEYEIKIALSGAPNSATLNVNLPSGSVIDTAKLPTILSATDDYVFGMGQVLDAGVEDYNNCTIVYNNTTSVAMRSGAVSGSAITAATQVYQASPITFGNGDVIKLHFSVPIVGWFA